MNIQIVGTVKEIGAPRMVGNAKQFKIFDVIVETDEKFPQTYKVEFTEANAGCISSLAVGNRVNVSCSLSGRRWEGNGKISYFLSLRGSSVVITASAQAQQATATETSTITAQEEADLPF